MKQLVFILSLIMSVRTLAQSSNLPIQVLKGSDASKPVIMYLSGDGGWNKFSNSFMSELNKHGYSIIGLNSRSYFWKKKTPKEAAENISTAVEGYMKLWKSNSFILIGYSFGADVAPFIQTNFSNAILNNLRHTVLMSPSDKTDFEVHVLGMLGFTNSGESVPDQINKLSKPLTIIYRNDEKELALKNKVKIIKLDGGHHYDGHVEELVKKITETF
ncbi:MAG TPA: AcvB/VirJ family lysyl-phosphatidylglycerol hydrolase [Flavisolibacter sp.]|nr:AcvB/VirJ family lysyl-phosphatidylglycerol hydrolase [Flavisolibacter sp.]